MIDFFVTRLQLTRCGGGAGQLGREVHHLGPLQLGLPRVAGVLVQQREVPGTLEPVLTNHR